MAQSAKRPAAPSAKPPVKKPGKSIVNQKSTPWGLVAAAVAVVLFAVGIIGYAVTRPGKPEPGKTAIQAALKIKGVTFSKEPDRNHVQTKVTYDHTPPIGGNHSQIWADCTGTVYANPIANENAVHALEHGAVWITYRPGLEADQVSALKTLVDGRDRMMMSPYPGLKTAISVQAWSYQLSVDSASDSRIQQFIDLLRYNPESTPEYAQGVTCSDPQFKATPSTFDNPLFVFPTPATTASPTK